MGFGRLNLLVYNLKMNKLRKIIENISLGLFVNGSFTISQDGLTTNAILITAISLYAMIITVIFEED